MNDPVVGLFAFGGPAARLGLAGFAGVSLPHAAWRDDGGCEGLAVPGLVLGHRTPLACLASTPVDRAERALAGRR